MVRTARFRRQHDEIMAIVQEISSHLTDDLKKDASQVPQLLSTLAGKLTVHLAMEDNALYPSLLKDDQLRPLAERFMTEMGGISATFKEYVRKWPDAGAIEGRAAEFIQETKRVFATLTERIIREDQELYPLVDALGG
ncbi:MAG: hemerythrin domain-containing protein [Limnochordia bacterium]